ncbi:MAG: tetratricopeptide repeat protein [Planctomycetes bacterium]|nr:tetratricopeptide repeat protein [Planctomycetota bacterium]
MGIGGTSFRRLAFGFGVLGAIAIVACRTGLEPASLHELQVVVAPGEPSLALGHRFGRWLEVEVDPAGREALEQACLLEQKGESERAIELLGEALRDVTHSAPLFLARGALYVAAGYPRAAAGDFQRAVDLAPDRADGWYALGHAYEVLGLSRQALEALKHALALGRENSALQLSLARVYRALGRLGPSARHYELALAQLDPPPADLLIEAAVLTTEDSTQASGVEALRERLESCEGVQLSDDAWLLRALLREVRGEPFVNVAATFRAIEVGLADLALLTQNLLIAQQLDDPETAAEARARVLAGVTDAARRTALERCLPRP